MYQIILLSMIGIYETPGGTILFNCHLDIETLTMDKVNKNVYI
jgi:argininosuccinate synthase